MIEAGASGKPVVAAKVGGVPEVVRDGETGLLFTPQNADSLAGALVSLLDDEKKRLKMGETAKMWVDDKFSASVMVQRFSDLYVELSNNRNGRNTL